MRWFNPHTFVAALALVLSAGMARAETISPYDTWAKLKPGSSVTLKMKNETSGQKTEMLMTYVLDEVTPEKAVVEMKGTLDVAGTKMEMPAQKMEIPKGAGGVNTPNLPPTNVPGVKESDETVKIDGKEYKCHVIEASSEVNGSKVNFKTWVCADVPNALVKSETSAEGAVTSKTSMELVKVELK